MLAAEKIDTEKVVMMMEKVIAVIYNFGNIKRFANVIKLIYF